MRFLLQGVSILLSRLETTAGRSEGFCLGQDEKLHSRDSEPVTCDCGLFVAPDAELFITVMSCFPLPCVTLTSSLVGLRTCKVDAVTMRQAPSFSITIPAAKFTKQLRGGFHSKLAHPAHLSCCTLCNQAAVSFNVLERRKTEYRLVG
jgi:hypothetical protein